MAKRSPIQATLDRLTALRGEAPSSEGVAALRKALGGRSNLAVAKAAAVAEAWGAVELAPDLADAFWRFMEDGAATDKGCDAKLALVECLRSVNYEDDALYLAGARHVQMEAAWGPPEDTAPPLRGACLQALAAMNYPGVHFELARLLADPEPAAHQNAIKTAVWLNDERSELLLRMDASIGNRRAAITQGDFEANLAIFGDIFQGLMSINGERSLPFVTDFLFDDEDTIFEGAALAIGESKLPAAIPVLQRAWERNVDPRRREALMLPFALHRSEEAFDVLLDVVANQRVPLALRAIEALPICATSEDRQGQVKAALSARSEGKLHEAYAATFESAPDP